MELDDLKSAWAQYDKKLAVNLKFNQELLRKMNLNIFKKELQKPLIYELSGVAVMFIFMIYVVASSIRFIDEPKYCIPGFISALLGLVFLVYAIIKANKFLSIDYYGSSVLKLQKEIATLNRQVLRLRKYELVLFPFLVLPLLPILFKTIHNIDIYQNIKLLSIEVILILGIGFPLTLWINKHLYDKKFKNAERLLQEIEKFESEE
ncbi:MAG: hypothetical protein VB110_08130 [Bacteroidales bacterium]|nr:hypothetical protein [Bacteroidales bacterium]